MARIVLNSDAPTLPAQEKEWAYCILDSCLTYGIHNALSEELAENPQAQLVYHFERAMQGPAMQMQLRGTRIDEVKCDFSCGVLQRAINRVHKILAAFGAKYWDRAVNFQNNHYRHLPVLFYTVLKVPPIRGKNKKITCNREALEKIAASPKAPEAAYAARAILFGRDCKKQLDVLLSKRDPRGRFRSSFNVGATETGRWSSSKNCFGEGNNQQNVTPPRRGIFIPDAGWKLGNADLKQAESLVVAHLCGDAGYIEAHEAGDTHTYVARLLWPEVPWTFGAKCTLCEGVGCKPCGGSGTEDRRLAEKQYYRHFSRRDLAKRVQHGSNYGMSEFLLARILKVELRFARDIQGRYFTAFPGIKKWHEAIRKELRARGQMTTALGRQRQFLGRLYDEATVREAISNEPQSIVADVLNRGLWTLWERYDPDPIQVLQNGFDSVLFQHRADFADKQLVIDALTVPFKINGREVTIGVDCKLGGANWKALK